MESRRFKDAARAAGACAFAKYCESERDMMKEYTPVKEGKVREIYDIGDALVMVATDRISAARREPCLRR